MKALPLMLAAGGGYLLWANKDQFGSIFGGGAAAGSTPATTTPSTGSGSTPATTTPSTGSGSTPATTTPSTGSGSTPATTPDPAKVAQAAIDAAYPDAAKRAPVDDLEALTRKAAAGDTAAIAQADAKGIKYNSDQWNWFRWQANGDKTTTDLFPAGDRNFPMLASDYIARRKGAGLSGLGTLGAYALVSAAIAEAARSRRTSREPDCSPFGMFRLPSGACTAVDPAQWTWQCQPGIGNEASCVGVPEPEFVSPVQQGLLPTIPAPAPIITRLDREATDRYHSWDSCHERGPLWFQDIPLPCGPAVSPDGAPSGDGSTAVVPLDVQGGNMSGCLLACFVVAAAAFEVVGHHGRR